MMALVAGFCAYLGVCRWPGGLGIRLQLSLCVPAEARPSARTASSDHHQQLLLDAPLRSQHGAHVGLLLTQHSLHGRLLLCAGVLQDC